MSGTGGPGLPSRGFSGPRRAERPEEGAPGVREDRGGSAPSQAQPHKKVFKLAVPCTSAQCSERADRTWSEGLRRLSSGGRDITGTLHRKRGRPTGPRGPQLAELHRRRRQKGSRPAEDRKPRNVKGLPDPQWSGAREQFHRRSLTGTPAGACRTVASVCRSIRQRGRRGRRARHARELRVVV